MLLLSQNSRDLVTLPFIGKCLTVAGDTSIKLKMSLSPTIRDLLFQGGVERVLGNTENKILPEIKWDSLWSKDHYAAFSLSS